MGTRHLSSDLLAIALLVGATAVPAASAVRRDLGTRVAGPLAAPRLISPLPGVRLASKQLGPTSIVDAPRRPAPAQVLADPCIQCGTLYAADPSGNIWQFDPDTNGATLLGNLPFPLLFDIGISSAGDLYGLSSDGDLLKIDACGLTSSHVAFAFGNALGGATASPDLYIVGPPLGVYEIDTDNLYFRGGNLGTDPPDWCGLPAGDVVQNPADGLLYATLSCPECVSGDMLVTIDPATGNAVTEVGCIRDAVSGLGYGALYGLAFDGQCRLFASPGFGNYILQVDPATAIASIVPIGGGYTGAYGLASFPCGPCGAGLICAPYNHGWWHRECLGAGLIDPGRSGHGAGPGPTPRSTSYDPSAFVAADADMAPHGTGACQALDEGPFSDPRVAALRELATIHLDIRAKFLSRTCPVELRPVVDRDGLTVGDAIDIMEALLATGAEADARDARWIGEHVVNREALIR